MWFDLCGVCHGALMFFLEGKHCFARVHWCCWRWSVLGCVGNLFVVQMVWFWLHPLQQWSMDPGSHLAYFQFKWCPFFSTSHVDFQRRRAPMAVRGWTCATLSASGIGWWDLVGLCMAMTWCGVSFVSDLWPGHSYFSASPGQCCFGKKRLWACVCTLYDIMLHYMTWKTPTSDIGIFTYGIN